MAAPDARDATSPNAQGDGTRCDVTLNASWQSSALAVASVSDAGIAIALGEGSTVIGAALYGMTGEAGLTVTSGDAGASDADADANPDADASSLPSRRPTPPLSSSSRAVSSPIR